MSVYLFERLNTLLLDKLAPLVSEVSGIKQIQLANMGDGKDIAELIDAYRSRMPGAFLSFPQEVYDSKKEVRACDSELTYILMIGVEATRPDVADRMAMYAKFRDLLLQRIFYQRLPVGSTFPANLDFIRPVSTSYGDNGDSGAMITSFTLKVRNQAIAEPQL